MRAIVYDRYGSPDVLELAEIDKPVVRDDEVLVRVHAAAVNPADWHFMRGLPYIARVILGWRRPRPTVLASDMAGQVEAVGANVTQFRPGDEVFGRTRTAHRPDRPAAVDPGGCAEYACVPEDLLALKPASLTFEQAAAVPLGRADRPAGAARRGPCPGWAEGPDQRRLRRCGDIRRADREVVRRRGDRRVQHEERGHGPIDRRRSGHRLHPAGLHPERAALRPHPRHRGSFAVRLQTRAHPRGTLV